MESVATGRQVVTRSPRSEHLQLFLRGRPGGRGSGRLRKCGALGGDGSGVGPETSHPSGGRSVAVSWLENWQNPPEILRGIGIFPFKLGKYVKIL